MRMIDSEHILKDRGADAAIFCDFYIAENILNDDFFIYDIEIKIDENDGLEAHCERQRSGCGHFPADVVSRNRRPKHRFDFQTLPAIFVQNDAPSPPPPTPPSNTVHSCWTCLFSGHLEGDGF